jgi:hypothetical protein
MILRGDSGGVLLKEEAVNVRDSVLRSFLDRLKENSVAFWGFFNDG